MRVRWLPSFCCCTKKLRSCEAWVSYFCGFISVDLVDDRFVLSFGVSIVSFLERRGRSTLWVESFLVLAEPVCGAWSGAGTEPFLALERLCFLLGGSESFSFLFPFRPSNFMASKSSEFFFSSCSSFST